MPINSSTPDVVISIAHPTDPDFTVDWTEFLKSYDRYVGSEATEISFTATFTGARSGQHRMRIDGLIRRFLDALGVDRREVLVGSYSARHARSM